MIITDWHIERYTPTDAVRWNQFITESRNGTFLFNREYMDYHSNRFADYSLLAFNGGSLAAILPANHRDTTLYSHGGLTYGGWVLPRTRIDGTGVVALFEEWKAYCQKEGFTDLIYKPTPYIYHLFPSEEDRYALFRVGAKRNVSQLSSVISYAHRRLFSTSRRRQLRRASETYNPVVAESRDFRKFWIVLEKCLDERHAANPVHTLDEIEMLAMKFPKNIKLFTISDSDGIQGGVVIYDTGITAHCQYIASTARARENNLLTVLFDRLIEIFEPGHSYFDFGTSNEDRGLCLNSGLLNQKYTLGGTGVTYDCYHLHI